MNARYTAWAKRRFRLQVRLQRGLLENERSLFVLPDKRSELVLLSCLQTVRLPKSTPTAISSARKLVSLVCTAPTYLPKSLAVCQKQLFQPDKLSLVVFSLP